MAAPVKPNYDNVRWGGPDGLRVPTEVTIPNLYLNAALFPIVYILDASLGFAAFNSAVAVNMMPTTLLTGTYRISLYAVLKTAFATNTDWGYTFGWTDDYQAETWTVESGTLTIGTTQVGSQLIRAVTGTAVTYTPIVTGSNATTGVAATSIVVEKLI